YDNSRTRSEAVATRRAALPVVSPVQGAPVPKDDRALLDDLAYRSFVYFAEESDPRTGLVLDRAKADGSTDPRSGVASVAATGFGLSALCVAADRGWVERRTLVEHARKTLRFLADGVQQERGWFYHFVNASDGKRAWGSEASTIDTALALAGVLTVKGCLGSDPEVSSLASRIYERVDFAWMYDEDTGFIRHGYTPEKGFLPYEWSDYSENAMLSLLALGSPSHPLPRRVWDALARPRVDYASHSYVAAAPPLFTHQFSQAWFDFRGLQDAAGIDYHQNSVEATLAHRAFCADLAQEFPSYSGEVWGISASDRAGGYTAWGGPPRTPDIDGTVVPYAAAGSLMFTPELSAKAVRAIREKHPQSYGRYGFVDAFNPQTGWTDPDSLGIDVGISLLSAENARAGTVWKYFMSNPEAQEALRRAGFRKPG
ncbi:MAG: glucoamylase family protein, partial [Elusimicrobia bacterium]|nr:glucoamylase family protein [Elusimicrobiota bacterium]